MISTQLCLVRRYTPPGLANPVASLAVCLLSPIPTAHDSPVRSATARRTSRATASGSSVSTPRNASSHPATSTTTGNSRNTAITRSETSS